ncbi:synaptojanin isoform X2 [Oratosquilla oratoria]|uniref:synaptojanin isoform X2 n=1 Tax=Oratosquilla oratoria TaxID=337810 RepID=UPI003F768D16
MATLGLRLYQKTDANADFAVLLENKKAKTSLLFQAGTIATLTHPETDAIRSDFHCRLLDCHGCLGVLQFCPPIHFPILDPPPEYSWISWEGENTQLYLVVVTRCSKICSIFNSSVYKIQEVDIISLQAMRPANYKPQEEDQWMKEMKKVLGNESFYFSLPNGPGEQLDLTLCAQRRTRTSKTDNKFFWNRMLHLHPKRFGIDCEQWLIKIMCGSIEFSTIYMNNHTPKILLISRLSCERAGTRFMVRGVNDNGHVANFVETEQLIHVDSMNNTILSYIQTRGTVPLFWEQPGLNVGSHKVKMSREPEVSVQAFQKHARFLREKYGKQVTINLLGTGVTGKSQGEAALSHMFQIQHKNCPWSRDGQHVVFDFHQECRGGNTENLAKKLKTQISNEIEEFGYFCSRSGVVQSMQQGSIRSNCLDCLDRTNRVQTFLGLDMLQKMLEYLGVLGNYVMMQRFTQKLEEMWKDNGNRISQIYAGTGALQGSKLIDGARSAARTIQNNLLDSSKQEAIDILLHGNLLNNYLAALSRSLLPTNLLVAPFTVLKQMCDGCLNYTTPIPFRVAVGTYNVNGGKHFRSLAYKHLSLDDWLLDSRKHSVLHSSLVDTTPTEEEPDGRPPDIFAIGFEEIVDLNATNIVQNTQWSENAASWGRELQKVISRDEKFVMVTWSQLVGVALFVFVNERHASHVKDVSVESVKTGMQGATGNKGAVGIRMVIRNTSMAFVCSHFAAGQKEVNERNNDYDTIARKLIFPLGQPLWAHDYVFWCGDFNYRINLSRDEVIDLVQRQEWSVLLQSDQLKLSYKEEKCFKGFIEGDINFAPTYKYDLFSDDYDTSEKARVPAWTDRVLFWRRCYARDKENPKWHPGDIVHYGRAELKQSDHRPVLCIIDIEGQIVVEGQRDTNYQNVVQDLGPSDCTVVVQIHNLEEGCDAGAVFDDDLLTAVQEAMGAVGSVVLVRFVDNKIWFTFADSRMALQAVQSSPLTIGGHTLEVQLKTPEWRNQLEEELALCGDSTMPLTDEVVQVQEQQDVVHTLRNMQGALESLYSEHDNQINDGEVEHQRASPQPPRPTPPRPIPSRPPPPRPTPPSSAPSSPATARSQKQQGPKVMVITKPIRPTQVATGSASDTHQALNESSSTQSLSSTTSSHQGHPPIPPWTPSLEETSPTSEMSQVDSSQLPHTSAPSPPPSAPPPSQPPTAPQQSHPPSAPPPSLPPSAPPPSLPPSAASPPTPPISQPSGPPPALPRRDLPPVPSRGGSGPPPSGPPPPIPSRTLPPVPARNLPPVPPRK